MDGAIAQGEGDHAADDPALHPAAVREPGQSRDPPQHHRRGDLAATPTGKVDIWWPASAPAAPSPASARCSRQRKPSSGSWRSSRPPRRCSPGGQAGPAQDPGHRRRVRPGDPRHVADRRGHQGDQRRRVGRARRLAGEEGLLAGISSGAAVWAAIEVASVPRTRASSSSWSSRTPASATSAPRCSPRRLTRYWGWSVALDTMQRDSGMGVERDPAAGEIGFRSPCCYPEYSRVGTPRRARDVATGREVPGPPRRHRRVHGICDRSRDTPGCDHRPGRVHRSRHRVVIGETAIVGMMCRCSRRHPAAPVSTPANRHPTVGDRVLLWRGRQGAGRRSSSAPIPGSARRVVLVRLGSGPLRRRRCARSGHRPQPPATRPPRCPAPATRCCPTWFGASLQSLMTRLGRPITSRRRAPGRPPSTHPTPASGTAKTSPSEPPPRRDTPTYGQSFRGKYCRKLCP